MIAWFVAAQIAAAPGAPLSPLDSTALALQMRRVTREFLLDWRDHFDTRVHGRSTSLRVLALHCHHDRTYGAAAAPNLIADPSVSRRSMCPIWRQDALAIDERASVDAALSPDHQMRMRRARATLLSTLDSAARLLPGDGFIAGQRVRMRLEQDEPSRAAAAAAECRAVSTWCGLLRGYVEHRRGHIAAATVEFRTTLGRAALAERCLWSDISWLLAAAERSAYAAIPCADREGVERRFWWLADPLWSDTLEDRWAEHMARMVRVALHAAPGIDERYDFARQHGGELVAEMVVRYGWPSLLWWGGVLQDDGHFGWLGWRDNALNVAPEYTLPRTRTVASLAAAQDPMRLERAHWDTASPPITKDGWDDRWWELEHYERAAGPLLMMPHQTVLFRRAAGGLLVMAAAIPLAESDNWAGANAHLIMSPAPGAQATAPARAGDGRVSTAAPVSGPIVASVEVVPRAGAAARVRVAVAPVSLRTLAPGAIALSEIALYAPGDADPPLTVEALRPQLLTAATVRAADRLGVFWETYGASPTDTLEVELVVTHEARAGLLRRLGVALRVAEDVGGSVVVRWRDAPSALPPAAIAHDEGIRIQSRAVAVDLSRLRPGDYLIALRVGRKGRGEPATTERRIVITR